MGIDRGSTAVATTTGPRSEYREAIEEATMVQARMMSRTMA